MKESSKLGSSLSLRQPPASTTVETEAKYPGFTEVICGDHEFSAWLRSRGWISGYRNVDEATYYTGPFGETFAIALYDNQTGARRIFFNDSFGVERMPVC